NRSGCGPKAGCRASTGNGGALAASAGGPVRYPATSQLKILWVNTNFLHPTTKGGQIRTLEMLRHLHRRHEIHYVAIENPAHPEGPRRSGEYSTRNYPYQYKILDKRSPGFFAQLVTGVFSSVPVAVSRFHPPD